jgi:hypothetical protein
MLRDAVTNSYEHEDVVLWFGREEADRALREAHLNAFLEWICLDLAAQKTELELYILSASGNAIDAIRALTPQVVRSLLPVGVWDTEAQLFLSDVLTVRDLLSVEYERPRRRSMVPGTA